MSEPDRWLQVRDGDHGLIARWDGGVTVVLLDESGSVIARRAIGEAATKAEVDTALRAIIRYEAQRRRARDLQQRARNAIEQSWALGGEQTRKRKVRRQPPRRRDEEPESGNQKDTA